MSPYLAGHPPKVQRSLLGPLLQVALALACFAVATWAYSSAPQMRATDIWIYNALAVVSALGGLLFLPFAVAALVRVLRNRKMRP